MYIRNASADDLDMMAEKEKKCFDDEALDKTQLKGMLRTFPQYFYLLMEEDELIGYVFGLRSDLFDFCDEMFDDPQVHDPSGKRFFIIGVAVDPQHQKKGYAGVLMRHVLKTVSDDGCQEVVLTCKEKLISFYAHLGFELQKKSDSAFAGKTWYQMHRILEKDIDNDSVSC